MSEAAIAAVDEANEEEQENQGQKRADLDREMEKTLNLAGLGRKERRKAAKKLKRKQARITIALKAREEEEARKNDPEEQRRIMLKEQEEAEIMERHRKEFEERERVWIERAVEMAEEEERKMMLEDESRENQMRNDDELNDDDAWDYVEEGPAEIIWQGNEIIVKKKSVRVPKRDADQQFHDQDADRPTSNPLPPQSEAFASYKSRSSVSSQEVFRSVAQQTPNFGTEQDKANCPFHIKTGACRFGLRCSRVHFYPDKSCTLLIKNMYNGPGIAWEQDEGLEFTDEEVERSYEEFYEDVHTEFLKFGEIVNFKVCKNGSFHLRGNVYVHYKSLESAILAYHSINGRYFAGKLITCEYVGVTRWKVAICGEYMKSRLKTCSHGTACNFIHCFRNPGGDYEWADWDNPPPKYWVKKMAALFGPSDETTHEKCTASDGRVQPWNSNRKTTQNYDSRYHSRRSRSKDVDSWDSGSGGDTSDEDRKECGSHSSRQKRSGSSRENELYNSESGKHKENSNFENDRYQGKNMTQNYDSGDSSGKDQDRGGSLSRTHSHHHKKEEVFLDNDDHNYDKNGVAEYDKYGGKEIRSRSSGRKHSKSKDRSSRRESLTRQTKKQKFSNEHVTSVEKYETGRTNGYGCRSKSNDRRSELNFGRNIDHYDRWEATYSEENEKSGCSNFDDEELCGGTHRSYDERHDMHDIKVSSRCQSQLSHRMRLNSLDRDTGYSEYEGYYEAKRSHEHRRKGKRATSETFSSEGKSEYENTRAHDSGENQSCRSSRRHHQSSNRRGKHEDYDKEDKVENSQLKRSRSRSPTQCSRRSKREKYSE